jgi:hypothetical protein
MTVKPRSQNRIRVLPLRLPNGGSDPVCLSPFAQNLLDPGDRLVDRLLGADALGGDAMDGVAPDVLAPDRARAPFVVPHPHIVELLRPAQGPDCCPYAVRIVRISASNSTSFSTRWPRRRGAWPPIERGHRCRASRGLNRNPSAATAGTRSPMRFGHRHRGSGAAGCGRRIGTLADVEEAGVRPAGGIAPAVTA